MSKGLTAIRDAAREYVSALEARRDARREMAYAAIGYGEREKASAEDRIAEAETTREYRAAVSRTRKALARLERLLAIEPRTLRFEASK